MSEQTQVATRVNDETLSSLDEIASKYTVSRSVVMRWAIENYIQEGNDK